MELRNITPLPDGRIDCELRHPVLGWIPFTAAPNDPDLAGRALHETLTKQTKDNNHA